MGGGLVETNPPPIIIAAICRLRGIGNPSMTGVIEAEFATDEIRHHADIRTVADQLGHSQTSTRVKIRVKVLK